MIRLFTLCLFATAALAQIKPNVPQPTNLDFREGRIGEMPPGWEMPQAVLDAGYRAELRQEGCGPRFPVCVAYVAPAVIDKIRAAELAQTFPADAYIGRTIRFSAWLRLEGGDENGYVHIRMRVDYPNGKVDMRDDVTVTSPIWQKREVSARVNPGAVSISIWARYVPSGHAWVAAPSFEVVDEPRKATFAAVTATMPAADAAGKTIRFSSWIKTENVSDGYAGLWWRADGMRPDQTLSFDNSYNRFIDSKPAPGNGVIRGAIGTRDWTRFEIELPVPAGTHHINFGLLFTGKGAAWFDALSVTLDGVAYATANIDFDFESAGHNGFLFPSDPDSVAAYKVSTDNTTAYAGRQSLKMEYRNPSVSGAN